jgi:arylformamidase
VVPPPGDADRGSEDVSHVYRNYDQAELDRQYTARTGAPDWEECVARMSAESARVRRELTTLFDVAYGPTAAEKLDIFPAARTPAPVLVFIHGGYWRMLSKDDVSLYAETFVSAGVHFVAVNYALAPGASIDEIVHQNRTALAWVWHHAAEFGGDRDRIFVAGRSAGGHLVGMMLASGWRAQFGLPDDLIKGGCAVSGLFDLEPVRLSYVNEWARLDADSARHNSPMLHLPEVGCPLILAYGERETDEFKRQSEIYAEAWKSKGWICSLIELSGHHHFSSMESMNDSDDPVTSRLLANILSA